MIRPSHHLEACATPTCFFKGIFVITYETSRGLLVSVTQIQRYLGSQSDKKVEKEDDN